MNLYLDPYEREEFIAECQWCARPCREGEYRRRPIPDEWMPYYGGRTTAAACLDCDAVLEGELAHVKGDQ
jgi:hypothetical protein